MLHDSQTDVIYLRSSAFLSRLFALTKQLRPSKSLTRVKVLNGDPFESTL